MSDLFGHTPASPAFVDIRNQRESVAEEKARLCMELNALCKTPPQVAQFSLDQSGSRLARNAQGGSPRTGLERFQSRRTAIGHQQHEGV